MKSPWNFSKLMYFQLYKVANFYKISQGVWLTLSPFTGRQVKKDGLVPTLKPSRPTRNVPGMGKCNNCPICPFVKIGKYVKATSNNTTIEINTSVNCKTTNIIYCISCLKCRVQYVGETERSLQERFSEHKAYVVNKHLQKATGAHYNTPGHSLSDMQVSVVEKVHSNDPLVRKEREDQFIRKLNTKYKGLNKK